MDDIPTGDYSHMVYDVGTAMGATVPGKAGTII